MTRSAEAAPLFFRALSPGESSQRARMLEAVTRSVATKGYAAVTVADVVGLAGVSRRTFYEHFTDKEDCFLAAFEAGGEVVRAQITAAVQDLEDTEWSAVLRVALATYLEVLACEPEFARTLKIDIFGAGPRAIEMGRTVRDRFVELLQALNRLAGAQDPEIGEVPELILRALVGGISQLVEWHILTRGAESLGELAGPITEMATGVIEGARPGGWATSLD
jgi:AcrR family transcriptional regulator